MSYTVLIVEDTRELAEIIQLILGKHDIITTFTEADGQAAIERFREVKPDLVLLDLNLPDMRGWHVLDELKRISDEEDDINMPKVVITTAYGDPANKVMGKLQEIVTYLVKPFKPSEVEKVVMESLGIE
ncbi:MAG: response regulator [Chloroflexi bacterium]|nr:response regulator [Chloroflexota bacterium]